MRAILVTTLSLAAMPAAGDFSLAFPVDCVLGETCHIQQGVDHDPTEGAADFQCGALTYDDHRGTDIALPSLAAQEDGVAVLAAAAGTVRALRDELPDILQGTPGAPDVSNVECGNGILIRSPDGWEVQYCHLALGSVAVAVGDDVAVGDTLGMIGLSGNTEFPHLHLAVRRNGNIIDPFDPDGVITCGAPSTINLWDKEVSFEPGGFISAGFATAVPDFDAIKAGTAAATVIASNDPALVLWGYAFGSRSGDQLQLTLTGPNGVAYDHTEMFEQTQAQFFRAGGKRTPHDGWPVGTYVGEMSLSRDGSTIDTHRVQIEVVAP